MRERSGVNAKIVAAKLGLGLMVGSLVGGTHDGAAPGGDPAAVRARICRILRVRTDAVPRPYRN